MSEGDFVFDCSAIRPNQSRSVAESESAPPLEQFAGLAECPDLEVLEFAMRWGPLFANDSEQIAIDQHGGKDQGSAETRNLKVIREPVARWRECAARTREILTQATKLHRVKKVTPAVEVGRLQVSQQVQNFIAEANLRPHFHWDRDRPEIIFRGDSLLGRIALRITSAISHADALATCSACGMPFIPMRRLRSNNHYCRHCGRKAAMREASRRYRLKKKT